MAFPAVPMPVQNRQQPLYTWTHPVADIYTWHHYSQVVMYTDLFKIEHILETLD